LLFLIRDQHYYQKYINEDDIVYVFENFIAVFFLVKYLSSKNQSHSLYTYLIFAILTAIHLFL
jgi:hypothetical protein